jgi:hypothetical protein
MSTSTFVSNAHSRSGCRKTERNVVELRRQASHRAADIEKSRALCSASPIPGSLGEPASMVAPSTAMTKRTENGSLMTHVYTCL